MVNDILAFLEYAEQLNPIGAHPKCWSMWKASVETQFKDEILSNIEENQQSSTLEVFHGCLEYREQMHALAWKSCMQAATSSLKSGKSKDKDYESSPWKHLLEQSQIAQRTTEWYEEGKQILTASEFWKVLDTPRSYSNLIVSKLPAKPDAPSKPPQRLACKLSDMNAMDWGTCLEPVVKYVLKEEKGWCIRDLGRIRHPNTQLKVAASPDGIIEDLLSTSTYDPTVIGNLIEIKCPRTRALDSSAVPFEYWCQMQIQMAVTGRPACEYVEMKFNLRVSNGEPTPPFTLSKQQIAVLQNIHTLEMRYLYGFDCSAAKVVLDESTHCVEHLEWECISQRHVQIPRDDAWFQSVIPIIEQFTRDLEAAHCGSWQPMPPVERKKRAVAERRAPDMSVCAIVESPPSSPKGPQPVSSETCEEIAHVDANVPISSTQA